jgi:hypothetical protein
VSVKSCKQQVVVALPDSGSQVPNFKHPLNDYVQKLEILFRKSIQTFVHEVVSIYPAILMTFI